MRYFKAISLPVLTALLVLASATALAQNVPLANWPVPSSQGRQPLGLGDPGLFVAITPCRVADTRQGFGFTGQYGPPALLPGPATRNMTIGGQCGIPGTASVVSFNFTVLYAQGPGYFVAYPQGGTFPTSSILNFGPGQQAQVNNAAMVPLGAGGITLVAGGSGCDVVVDVNGYFIDKDSTLPSGAPAFHYLGVIGTIDPNAGLPYGAIFAQNLSTQLAYSIKADIANTITGSAAIAGRQVSASAATNAGVYGVNSSTGSGSAGVKGEALNTPGNGVLGVAAAPGYALYAQGNSTATGTKSFVEPHPTDPELVIRYVSLEGPEAGTYFRGHGRFENRSATIEVPEDFRAVTDSEALTVHVTPIGGPANVWVNSVDLKAVSLGSTRDVEFSYIVHGVRRAFRDFKPVQAGGDFIPAGPNARIPSWVTDEARDRLIKNGTYNEDGTANERTAIRHGWFDPREH